MSEFYKLDVNAKQQLSQLSLRLSRLVEGAVLYHSLIQPGRTLRYKIYMGEKWQYPRLTDTSTLNGTLTEESGLEPIAEFTATSTVHPSSTFSPHYFAGDAQIVDHGVRYILLTPDDATDEDVEADHPVDSRKVRIYKKCERTAPVAFDFVREAMRLEREAHGRKSIPAYEPDTVDTVNASGKTHHPWVEVPPGATKRHASKAVIIAMHWLQAGGAERWGMETVRLTREAGFTPIVITDRDSHQPWITSSDLDGAIVMPLTHPMQERVGDVPILRALFEQFDIRGVLIHHCQWMYDRAWWVKRYYPQTRIVDSLHIVEYVMQGGYPRESVARDEWIDLHHVISPQLERWMVETHHIAPDKVVDAPLVGLTTDMVTPQYKQRRDNERLTVAFVGRMSRQKRPEAFILVAKALAKTDGFRFIMHGSGEMDGFVDGLIKRYGLQDVVERRSMDMPVSETYQDSDVLLVSSINEGITLTSIEAITAGIPVLSANVGSQDTLIPPQGLLRRMTVEFVRDAKRSLTHILEREDDRKKLWETEWKRLHAFSAKTSANEYFKHMLNEWSK